MFLCRASFIACILAVHVATSIASEATPQSQADNGSALAQRYAKKKRVRTKTAPLRQKNNGKKRRIADNMPNGFTWPPSKAMRKIGAACKHELTELGISFKDAKPTNRIAAPISLAPSKLADGKQGFTLGGVTYASIFRSPPFVIDCNLALTLVKHGDALTKAGIKRANFSRIYGYTKVRVGGKTKNVLSRHALGLAIDIYSFVDDNDQTWVVKSDYHQQDSRLPSVEDALNASGGFRLVLSPKNDPRSHHDHFHIEAKIDFTRSRPEAEQGGPRAEEPVAPNDSSPETQKK